MVDKNKRLNEIIQKHKPLTKQDVVKTFKEQAEIKKKFTTNALILEQNLKKFNDTSDPLIDPESEDPLCWVRRPTTGELEAMLPTELLEYKNSAEEVPIEIMRKYEDFQFEMMANLITIPKHDAKWWKNNANLVFQSLFQKHLTGVLEDLGIASENF